MKKLVIGAFILLACFWMCSKILPPALEEEATRMDREADEGLRKATKMMKEYHRK